MSKVTNPQGYHAPLSVYELQRAIEFIKSNFQDESVQRAESAPRIRAAVRGGGFRPERQSERL